VTDLRQIAADYLHLAQDEDGKVDRLRRKRYAQLLKLTGLKQALGHRSITSTVQYVGTSDGQAAEAAQAALMRLY
jgi:hypothetical protein